MIDLETAHAIAQIVFHLSVSFSILLVVFTYANKK